MHNSTLIQNLHLILPDRRAQTNPIQMRNRSLSISSELDALMTKAPFRHAPDALIFNADTGRSGSRIKSIANVGFMIHVGIVQRLHPPTDQLRLLPASDILAHALFN